MMDATVCASMTLNASAHQLHGHGQNVESPVFGLTHRGVELKFRLSLRPKQVEDPTNVAGRGIEIYLQSTKKPDRAMNVRALFTMVKGGVADVASEYPWKMEGQNAELLFGTIPHTYQLLRSGGYLSMDNRYINCIVEIYVKDEEFQVVEDGIVFHTVIDETGFDLFQTIDEKANDRIRFISGDGKVFWVHKEVLFSMSGYFKDFFDKNRPRKSWSPNLVEGFYTFATLDRNQLRDFLEFVYTKQTRLSFGSSVMALLPIADQFFMPRLKNECKKCILGLLDQMNLEKLMEVMGQTNLLGMGAVTYAVVYQLTVVLKMTRDISLERLTEAVDFGKESGFPELIEAVQMNLANRLEHFGDRESFRAIFLFGQKHELATVKGKCLNWLTTHFHRLSDVGFINEMLLDFNFSNVLLEAYALG